MEDIKSKIVGGIVVLILGGTGFAVSQTDIVNNFADETGMSQEEARQYVEDVQDDLDTFTNIGNGLVDSSKELINYSYEIDCYNFTYDWVSYDLSCEDGKSQLYNVGLSEQRVGHCLQELGTNLGSSARAKIKECIQHLDSLNGTYNYPILSKVLDFDTVDDLKKSTSYNKSVLKAALESD